MNEGRIVKKNIILLPNIKEKRIKIDVKSKVFYDFYIEVEVPESIIFQDLIKGIFDGLYIKPNINDIFFYFVNTELKINKLNEPINTFGLNKNSYIIYLDEKKYIESSSLVKTEIYYLHHKENRFNQIPVYLEQNKNNFFLDTKKKCNNKVKTYNYNDKQISYLPIIIIKLREYDNFINFMKSYYKYYKYKDIDILIEKLILPSEKNYLINHIPNNKEANFFAEVTDSNNYKIYLKDDIKHIINMIKIQSCKNNIIFQDKNFKLDIEKWVRTVFNILAEYIQFFLNINPIYYVCKKCSYPVIFLDKRNLLSYIELIIKKLDKKIKEEINIINCIINLITPSFFKDESLPEINILYYNEDINENTEKECEFFSKNISGLFIRIKNIEELEIIINEIYNEYIKDNKISFQLILSENSCENFINFIFQNESKIKIFDKMCLYIYNQDYNYENIKKKFQSKGKQIEVYSDKENILELFIKVICIQNPSKCYNYSKIINYEEYIQYFYKFHEKISLHYGDISIGTFNSNIGIIQDFINSMEEKDLKIKTNGRDKKISLMNTLLIFEKVSEQKTENFKDVITNYTKEVDSFYQDLNTWLRKLDYLAYDKIGFFVADFMFCVNKYGEFCNKGIKKKKFYIEELK